MSYSFFYFYQDLLKNPLFHLIIFYISSVKKLSNKSICFPMTNFDKVKHYLLDLGYEITHENSDDDILIVQNEDKGICNMILDCEGDVLIMEQHILDLINQSETIFKKFLQINRELVHGAFVLDESGDKVLFRDTLALENLDKNELDSSFSALAIALVEHAEEFMGLAKK